VGGLQRPNRLTIAAGPVEEKEKGKKWKAKRSFGLKLEIKYKRAVEFWSSNRFKDFDQKQRGLNISKPKFQLDFKIE
jgi:hypothetical protein